MCDHIDFYFRITRYLCIQMKHSYIFFHNDKKSRHLRGISETPVSVSPFAFIFRRGAFSIFTPWKKPPIGWPDSNQSERLCDAKPPSVSLLLWCFFPPLGGRRGGDRVIAVGGVGRRFGDGKCGHPLVSTMLLGLEAKRKADRGYGLPFVAFPQQSWTLISYMVENCSVLLSVRR